ncbi:MAG: hypothetical protein KBD76_03345 [Bacteriovorax sp.]|nr:hypothetical protein [Bacteriovorax sp.]
MMDFLSDVFEFDVDAILDSVQRGPLYLKFIQIEPEKELNRLDSGIVFTFRVKSEDELKEMMSKYNFFLYRKSQGPKVSESLKLIQDDNRTVLSIIDIDQRQWRFELFTMADF